MDRKWVYLFTELEAAEATLMPGFWRLKDVREATAGDSSIRSDTLSSQTRDYIRTQLATVISLRNLAFVDRYQ